MSTLLVPFCFVRRSKIDSPSIITKSADPTLRKKRVPKITTFYSPKGSGENIRESAILQSLVPPSCFTSFREYCNHHTLVFGSPGADRRPARDRRYALQQLRKNNFESFRSHCLYYKIDCPATLEECIGSHPPTAVSTRSTSLSQEVETIVSSPTLTVVEQTLTEVEQEKMSLSINPFVPRKLLSAYKEDGEGGKWC